VAKEITIEEITTALPVMIRASGWFYMEAARALTEDFGAEGERTVRRWLRRWGQWRGRELRKGHMALGLPINVETLCKNWDSAAATYHLMDEWVKEGSWHPGNVKVPVKKGECACPVSEPWRESDFWLWGHVLCDEFHIQFVRGYHPDAVVVIPECIMKRDDACTFNFDHPYRISWETETKVNVDGIEIEVSYCPCAETWNWLGGLSSMRVYCERCYSGIASNYDAAFTAEVPQCKTRGDEVCRIRINGKAS